MIKRCFLKTTDLRSQYLRMTDRLAVEEARASRVSQAPLHLAKAKAFSSFPCFGRCRKLKKERAHGFASVKDTDIWKLQSSLYEIEQ